MAPPASKRSLADNETRRPKKKLKVKKQSAYHSSSEDEEDGETARDTPAVARAPSAPKSILKPSTLAAQVDTKVLQPDSAHEKDQLDELEQNTALNAAREADSDGDESDSAEEQATAQNDLGSNDEDEDDDTSDSDNDAASASEAASSTLGKTSKKRNDPAAFATSISKILGTKLSQPKREDPILSRSKDLSTTRQALADSKLEQKARALLRAEKKQSLENGRVKDVLGLEAANVDTGALLEEEKRLKKTAQRGVVRLFNAVRAAQVKAEEGMKQAKEEGLVGMQKREDRVNEMSKQGFLDLISQGGRTSSQT